MALLNLQSICKWSQENQHSLKTSLQVIAKLEVRQLTVFQQASASVSVSVYVCVYIFVTTIKGL